jgi:outer membrane protein TolC
MSITSLFRRSCLILTGLLALPAAWGVEASGAASRPTVTLAVVRDGPAGTLDELDASLRRDFEALDGARWVLRFKEAAAFDGVGTVRGAHAALAAALADPEVDLVMVLGPQVTAAAADPTVPLGKAVVGAIITDPDLLVLPMDAGGFATKRNFAVAAARYRSVESLRELRSILPFSSLTVLADAVQVQDQAVVEPWRAGLESALGVPVALVPLADTAAATLSALPAEAGAVFLLPAPRFDAKEHAALFAGLAARRLPAFSFLGQAEVEAGALAGLLPDLREFIARRAAVNFDQLISGAPPIGLPLTVPMQPQLFVNEATAAAIGAPIDFRVLSRARLVGRSTGEVGSPLTFEQAVLTALEKNFDLRIRREATESARQSEHLAGSALAPQVAATYGFQRIDRDRAMLSGGLYPETAQRAGLALQQALLDDEAWSRRRAAREAYRGATFQEQAERLAVVERTAQAYLQYLSAQSLVRIAGENLAVTQRNLELAHLRRQVGTSGPEEGFRFESLEAQQRADLIAARTRLEQARVAFNRVLAVAAEARWSAEDVGLDHPAFTFAAQRVAGELRSQAEIERFRSFGAAYALRHSPELAALEQVARAQTITVGQKARRPLVPRVGLSVGYQRVLENDYAGPSLIEQLAVRGVLPPPPLSLDRDEWNVALTASLPLFTGGGLTADLRKARADLRQLELGADNARAAIVARAQAACHALEGSYPSIELAQRSADRAQQNLRVVQDKYEQGTVSIINLLDAQNAAFSQKQAAALAVYRFLGDLVAYQRALGWFEVLSTSEEKEAWFREMDTAVRPP